MGVNMYDQAAQMPLINTYVPINFGELYRIASTQKEEIDKAQKQLNEGLQKFGEFTSPSDIDTQNYYNLSINQFQDLIDIAVNNPDAMKDASFRAKLNQRFNNLDYAALSRLKQGAENLKARNLATAKMKASGLYNYNWDVYKDKSGNIKQFDVSNYDTLNEGILDQLSPIQYKSLREIVQPYVEGIKPTFYAGNVDPNTGIALAFTKGYQAITKKELSNVLDKSYDEILATPQGQMWYRDIYNSLKMVNPQATEDDAMAVFKDNIMRDASYKLVSAPIDDEYAMRQALQQEEMRMKLRLQQAENQTTGQLSWEDVLSTQNAQAIKNNIESIRQGDPEFAKKYQDSYDSIAEGITNVSEIAIQNPEFKQLMEFAITRQGANMEQAIDFAFKNSQSLGEDVVNTYLNLQNGVAELRNQEIDEATGKILQRTFNATLGRNDMNSNPFGQIRTQLEDGQMYYDESLVHQMYEDGVYQISQKISPQVKIQLQNMMFSDDRKISTEVGYSFVPSGKLLSPKKFISNNNYINNLAKLADFDIEKTKLNRSSLTGDQDFDIEEKISKGEFGNVAVSDIIGYLDTPGERSLLVKVNVPLQSVIDKYDTWFSTRGNVKESLDKTYQITVGDGEDSTNLPGRWKDGYITTTMLMPVSNDDLDKIQANRLWQKDIGTSATKEKQIGIDDTILTNAKNYKIGFGLTK